MRKEYLIVLLTLCLVGCHAGTTIVSRQTDGMTAREIVEKNVFIDMSAEELNPQTRAVSALPPLALNPAFRAACYRFHKAMTIDENNIAVCHAKNGAELNMSEAVFNDFLSET